VNGSLLSTGLLPLLCLALQMVASVCMIII
jgi:hypothetical protein